MRRVSTSLMIVLVTSVFALLTGCAHSPNAKNYGSYMNDPTVKQGASADVDSKVANKQAWNSVKVTSMTTVRRLASGQYATSPNDGMLSVRAVLVNADTKPVQGNWRCRFYDSNNLPLYDDKTDQTATTANGLGWHQMVVYPVKSKSQTVDANVIHCLAATKQAVDVRIEFHDTSNDITVYHN